MGEAWPLALSPSNLIAGFCKSGIYPLNPGRISDHELGPSRAFQANEESEGHDSSLQSPPSSLTTRAGSTPPSISSNFSSAIDEILVLPKPKPVRNTRRKTALTSSAQCLTESPFIQERENSKKANTKPTKNFTNAVPKPTKTTSKS